MILLNTAIVRSKVYQMYYCAALNALKLGLIKLRYIKTTKELLILNLDYTKVTIC